jgi:hypothetical protein
VIESGEIPVILTSIRRRLANHRQPDRHLRGRRQHRQHDNDADQYERLAGSAHAVPRVRLLPRSQRHRHRHLRWRLSVVRVDNVTSSGAPTLRLRPGTGGSTYVEEFFADLWSGIATGSPFPDTVRADDHDTSEGLAWEITVPANGSVSVQYSTDLLLTQQ